MNLNPAWKVASVIVAVCLVWTQLEPAAYAQTPAEKASKQEGVASSENRIAMATPSTSAASAPAKPQAAASKAKSKWWVLLGIAAAGVASAVLIGRHQTTEPSITGLPPCIGAGC